MIFKALVDAIFNLFSFFINKFPDADPHVVTLIQNGLYDLKVPVAQYNWIFPMDTFFLIINLFLVLIVTSIAFLFTRWILSIITVNLMH